MPALVFLSHSSKDDDTVTRIHDEIEAATGEKVWVDHKDIEAGDHWQETIDTALADCTHMLVLLSKASVISREVTTEWRDALLRKKPLLPVIIDDLELTAIPARLRIIQPVNLTRDWDGGIKQLVDVIGRAHKGESVAEDFGRWAVTGTIDRLLVSIPISGREADIAKVQGYLKQAPTSILGVGGLGKSRLAAEIVLTQADTSGAVWHVCSEYSTADEVYDLLREHLGLDVTTPTSEVLKRLRTERLLVVLDNGESVGEKDERRQSYIKLVNDLHDTQSTQVLLTSRTEWTDIKAGKLHRLGEPEAAAAEQIVRDMARVFEITDYKADTYAAAMAEAARYHPRLIEWAVGKLAKFEPAKVIRELRELKSKDVQAALDEMIRQTVAQMTAAEGVQAEAALRRLVVCRGGFTYAAVIALLNLFELTDEDVRIDEDSADEILETLMAWQFVRRVVTDKGQTRYTIDALVSAAVVADETAPSSHFDYYQALARRHHNKQDYVGLAVEVDNLEAAFEWAMETGDYEKAYRFRSATSNFLANRGRFEQRKNWLERVASSLENHTDASLRANVQNDLGILYHQHPLGNRSDNLKRAVAAYEATLVHYTTEAAPLDYAMIQNNLGEAYRDLAAISERERNLSRAVAAYMNALVYYTTEAAPLDYAMTQNNLGAAYRALSAFSEREGNLKRAVAAYEAALLYRTAEAAPLDYAATQNNLGIAYRALSEISEREGNLKRAVEAYEAALLYRTAEAAPLDYAATQNNLGSAYRAMAQISEQEANLKRAVAAFEAALVYQTAETAPLDYAMTRFNIGTIYWDMENVGEALICFREALQIFQKTGAQFYIDHVQGAIDMAEAKLREDDNRQDT